MPNAKVIGATLLATGLVFVLGPPAQAGYAAALRRSPATTAPPSLTATVAAFGRLPGRVGLLVLRDGKVLAAHDSASPLAVGPAAMLAVMAALQNAYAHGAVKPDTVARLQDGDRSPGLGMLQAWPADTPLTLATAATLMAAFGDDTAADLLIRVLGRKAVEAQAPVRDHPFLTPREAAILKAPDHARLAAAWKATTGAARERLLGEIDAMPAPTDRELGPMPREPAIGWFYTPHELCALIDRVAGMPELGINPRLELPGWRRIAYGGGSEPGVVDLTYRLEARDGTRYCVTATWNDNKELGVYKFTALVARLIAALQH